MASPELLLCQQAFDSDRMPFEVNLDPETVEGRSNARLVEISGNCPAALVYLSRNSGLAEDWVEKCPATMVEMHDQGAPEAINCAVELINFAEATKG